MEAQRVERVGYGYETAKAAPRGDTPVAASVIGEATDQTDVAVKRLARVVDVLREFNNSTLGAEPTPLNGREGNKLESSNRSARLRSTLVDLHQTIDAIDRELERLVRI